MSLHDALPIYVHRGDGGRGDCCDLSPYRRTGGARHLVSARLWALSGAAARLCGGRCHHADQDGDRSEEHTSELQSLMRISYAAFCLKHKKDSKNLYKMTT